MPTTVLIGNEKALGERLGAADGINLEDGVPIRDGAVLGLKVLPDRKAVGKAVGNGVMSWTGASVAFKIGEGDEGSREVPNKGDSVINGLTTSKVVG